MDNRFPPVEREAWIILFIMNTGEAWNHTQRSMQELLFQLQPTNVHRGLYFPQHSTVFSTLNMFLPTYCNFWNKAVDYFNLQAVCILVIWSKFWLVALNKKFPLCNTYTMMECVRILRRLCRSDCYRKVYLQIFSISNTIVLNWHFGLGINKTVWCPSQLNEGKLKW